MMSIAFAVLALAQADGSKPRATPTEKPKLICREIKVTGSRLARRRFCATAHEWELAEKELQEATRFSQGGSTTTETMSESPPPQ